MGDSKRQFNQVSAALTRADEGGAEEHLMTGNQALEQVTKTATCQLCRRQISLNSDGRGTCPEDGCSISSEGTIFADTYLILETLGTGGWGTVFRCEHIHLKKVVALKILHAHVAREKESLLRFQREARILGLLSHPNMIAVTDHGWRPRPFIAMEYLKGRSLDELIASGPVPARKALLIFTQICNALSLAHEAKVIHRDLKPANIFLCGDPENPTVKVLDFGIAKTDEGASLTATGDTVGSLCYMSPEQCLGQMLDERADIYSMGCLMYETLTGKTVFEGDNALDVARKHLLEMPRSLEDAYAAGNLPVDLQQIVMTCLAKETTARYQDMKSLSQALQSVKFDYTVRSRVALPVAWPGALQAVIAVVVIAICFAFDRPEVSVSGLSLLCLLGASGGVFWLYCLYALQTRIARSGFKLSLNPLLTSTIVIMAPLAVLLCSFLQYALTTVFTSMNLQWLSLLLPAFSFTGMASLTWYLFYLPTRDFHRFAAERQGRQEVPYVRLLSSLVAGSSVIPYLALFWMPLSSYSILLRVIIAVVGWSMSFVWLQLLTNEIRNLLIPANATRRFSARTQYLLAASLLGTMMGVVYVVTRPAFTEEDQQLMKWCSRLPEGGDSGIEERSLMASTALLAHEDYKGVLSVAREASRKTNSEDYVLEDRLGWAYLFNREYEEAFDTLSAAAELPGPHPSEVGYLGAYTAAVLNNQDDKAQSIIRRACNTNSLEWPRTAVLFVAGRTSRATMFGTMPRRAGVSTEAHFYSGMDYWRNKDFAAARKEFNWVLNNGESDKYEFQMSKILLSPAESDTQR